MVTCPKCFQSDVTLVNNSHYICNNPNCSNMGKRVQFRKVIDKKIKFPYNQIFVDRSKNEFFRKPYLELETVGNEQVI